MLVESCIKGDQNNLCLSDDQKKRSWKEHYRDLLNFKFCWFAEDLPARLNLLLAPLF